MDIWDKALSLLPPDIALAAEKLPEELRCRGEEFRLRLGRAPALLAEGRELGLPGTPPVRPSELRYVVDRATEGSPYAWADGMASGYICAPGGLRLGVCGEMRRKGNTWVQSALSSLSLRIPGAAVGCAGGLTGFPAESTLICSPPGGGKTTLLRDMVRLLGDGGERVSLCDERGEVAGLTPEGFGFDVGRCTDVLTGCRKEEGLMLLLRSMNPTVLAVDEITSPGDIAAMEYASHCGVKLLATCHAQDRMDLRERPLYAALLERRIFSRLIMIENQGGLRTYREEAL